MSDEDEQQMSLNKTNFYEINNRRLSTIKAKLQELTREKTKYNVEKLIQDADFLQSELLNLSHDIAELNKEINTQIAIKKTLNTKIAMLRSNSSLRYANSKMALRDKERYEKEFEKANKTEAYRDLARQKIKSICEALPQLEKQDEYHLNLKQAEEKQILAQNKREKLQESLNSKSRKQTEIRQLLNDSSTKLPELELAIENLRLERKQIFDVINQSKTPRRSSNLQEKSVPSPVPSYRSLEQDTLELEKQQANDQLEKIRLLLKYFHEKMSEHNLTMNQSTNISFNRSNSLTTTEEQSILTSFMDEKDIDETTKHAIAMKLPRNFNSTTNEIIHSNENLYQYKKELPDDILDKYAGINNKKQSIHQNKKNKKNKKNFGIKHPSQMVSLYDDVRTSTGNSDTLPYMPLFEYELITTIKSLELLEQSIESYLNELNQHEIRLSIDENQSEIIDDEDEIQDSALDTYSETSSLIEPLTTSKDSRSLIPQLMNIPEARSSSSSDDKKTIASSTSPPSSHHGQHRLTNEPLTVLQESSTIISPLQAQIAQIERQISDEGYRSVRNEQQQTLTRSSSYDSTEKVDKWLSTTTLPLIDKRTEQNHFQATHIDDDDEQQVERIIPVSNH